jgi:hypothetical protein
MIELAPISEKKMTYSDAILYCRFCTYNGYTDWRMATPEEYSMSGNIFGWYESTSWRPLDKWTIQPVRDVLADKKINI